MYNIHFHIFDYKCVPEKFIPFVSDWLIEKSKRIKRFVWIMRNLNPFQDNDILDRYAAFLATMNSTQEHILKEQMSNYPDGTIMTPLTVDMENMGRGKVKKSHISQACEVIDIAEKYNNVRPFIMVDPRSKDIDILYKLMDNFSNLIAGIKLYPLMGYYPDDERLDRFYKLAGEYGWSVVMHCTPNNAVYYSGDDIDDLIIQDEFFFKGKNNKFKAGNFTHPSHLENAAQLFPDVNFSFAHFGGRDDWRDYIVSAIMRNDNLYTDISFTYDTKKELLWLKDALISNDRLLKHVMYGDDFYMPQKVNTESFYETSKKILGDELFNEISVINPRIYLNNRF